MTAKLVWAVRVLGALLLTSVRANAGQGSAVVYEVNVGTSCCELQEYLNRSKVNYWFVNDDRNNKLYLIMYANEVNKWNEFYAEDFAPNFRKNRSENDLYEYLKEKNIIHSVNANDSVICGTASVGK